MLRIEPINNHHDQAASAILELVDGPRDMRFAMTAKSLVRERSSEQGGIRDITARNVAKVTRFREGGEAELEKMVRRLETQKGWEEPEKADVEAAKEERNRHLPLGSSIEGWQRWDEVDRDRRKKVKIRAEKVEKEEKEARRKEDR